MGRLVGAKMPEADPATHPVRCDHHGVTTWAARAFFFSLSALLGASQRPFPDCAAAVLRGQIRVARGSEARCQGGSAPWRWQCSLADAAVPTQVAAKTGARFRCFHHFHIGSVGPAGPHFPFNLTFQKAVAAPCSTHARGSAPPHSPVQVYCTAWDRPAAPTPDRPSACQTSDLAILTTTLQ